MSPPHQFIILSFVILLSKEISCFCERSHIVICSDLSDIKTGANDTTSWKYLQIGSTEYRNELPNQVFDSSVIFKLQRTKFLTIINSVSLIKTPFVNIRYNKRLEYLNLYANNISEIEDFSFADARSLKEVYLMNNNIGHLGRGIFSNASLDIVDLSRNRLRSITTGFYFSNIKWIVLNHNEITFIKNDAFPRALEQLELNHNRLESLDVKAFANLKKLKELYLEHNLLKTVPNIVSLENIQYLHFGNNKIEEVHYRFDQHQKLEFIDFTANSIRNITPEVFSAPVTPPVALLSLNRLTNIVFRHPDKRTDLFIYGNPFNCDCLLHIERILLNNLDMKTCDIKNFSRGEAPVCIESGKCSSYDISSADIDRFLDAVSIFKKDLDSCIFRL